MTDQAIRVTPAGWYEDPADPGRVRWWNGVAWTEHTTAKPELEASSTADADRTVTDTAVMDTDAQAAVADAAIADRAVTDAAAAEAEPAADGDRPLTRREAIAAEGGRHAPDAGRSATGVIWLVALIPVIAFALGIAALYVYAYVASNPLVALIGLVPYLLGLLWAVSDSRQLAARGFTAPRPLWALLTPLAYLIARRVRVPGAGPLVLFVVTGLVAIAVPIAFWFSGAAGVVTVAARVQHAAVTQFVNPGWLRSVSCPPVLGSLTPGTLFTCDAVGSDGTPTHIWVSIDSASGQFSIALAVGPVAS